MTCLFSLQDYKEANEIDLVARAFALLETSYDVDAATIATYQDKPAKAVWATYRYQLLNCAGCGTYVDRWKQRFADRAYNLMEKYTILFKAYEELKSAGELTKTGSASKMTTQNNGTTQASSENTDTVTSENIPQYADASQGQWLNARNINKGSATANGSSADTGTVETVSALGMLPAELADKMRNALFNPYVEYAREFEDMFVPFYASRCGRCSVPSSS